MTFYLLFVRRRIVRKAHLSWLATPNIWPWRLQSIQLCHCLFARLFLSKRRYMFRISDGLVMLRWQDQFSLLAFPDGISTPLKTSNATRGPCPRWSLIRGCRSNRAIEEHTSSEKWYSSIRRFLSDPKGISCRWLNSMGTSLGRRPALAGFVVDQAIVWAEPHATRFVCLPFKGKHKRHQHRIKISAF